MTPKNSIERLKNFSVALDKLSLSDGTWPTDRNRRLKTEQLLRVALRALQPPEEGAATAEPEPTESDRANAVSALSTLQKLLQSQHANPVRPLLLAAVEIVKPIAGDAAPEGAGTAADAAAKATPGARAVPPRGEAIRASPEATRRPVRRGIV